MLGAAAQGGAYLCKREPTLNLAPAPMSGRVALAKGGAPIGSRADWVRLDRQQSSLGVEVDFALAHVGPTRTVSGDRRHVSGSPMQPTIICKTQPESADHAQFGPRVLRVEDMRHELPTRDRIGYLLPGLSRVC